ncbi:MAG TPA: hypothetical protein VK918_02310 [Pyrinomonadaceae bacterium]|nr:hypothetical protein [Pyrinomonadaceae bacterium]
MPPRSSAPGGLLLPVAFLWGLLLLVGAVLLWFGFDAGEAYGNFYLLPWILLTGIVVASPSIYLLYIGKFDLFHPLVFAAWSYIFPAFVIGGVIIAFDMVSWYFMSFIEDPRYNLPLTLVYIAIGYLGLTVGYFLPVGKWMAETSEKFFPKWDWRPDQVWLGGVVLLIIGIAVNLIGFIQGLIGYQRNIDIGAYDGLLYFLVTVLTAGSVLLWLAIFMVRERTGVFFLITALLIIFIPLRMALLGNRGSLFVGVLPVAFAFFYSGRKVRFRYAAVFALMIGAALFIGVAYGTAFRNIRGGESRAAAGDYMGHVVATVDHLIEADPVVLAGDVSHAFVERIENLSSVAIVVSNYEKLAPYEASYGLENNIINDLTTSFIPRFVWADKPTTSDPRAYSDLYFNFGDNSFAISPFGDLLRNFGPWGIPLGMMVLGFYLRLIYRALIETPTPAMWTKTVYFLMLMTVSYEAFYATIFPSVVRTAIVAMVAMIIVHFLVPKRLTR